jgi:hypothetical protein
MGGGVGLSDLPKYSDPGVEKFDQADSWYTTAKRQPKLAFS